MWLYLRNRTQKILRNITSDLLNQWMHYQNCEVQSASFTTQKPSLIWIWPVFPSWTSASSPDVIFTSITGSGVKIHRCNGYNSETKQESTVSEPKGGTSSQEHQQEHVCSFYKVVHPWLSLPGSDCYSKLLLSRPEESKTEHKIPVLWDLPLVQCRRIFFFFFDQTNKSSLTRPLTTTHKIWELTRWRRFSEYNYSKCDFHRVIWKKQHCWKRA